jgi:signal transduction histidine kinase
VGGGGERPADNVHECPSGTPLTILLVDQRGIVSRVIGADLEIFGQRSSQLRDSSVFAWEKNSPAAFAAVHAALQGTRSTLELIADQYALEMLFEPDHLGGCSVAILERMCDETPQTLRLWRFIFNQIGGAVWVTDRELRITHAVGRLARGNLHNLARIGASIGEILETRDESHPVIAAHRAALEGRSVGFPYRRNDRSYELCLEPLRDNSGEVTRAVGVAVDVTERETTLSLMTATFESLDDGVLVVDLDGHVTAFNRRFLELWHIPSELVTAKDEEALLSFVNDQLEDPQGFAARVRDLYAQPNVVSHDTLWFKDGRVFERISRPQLLGDRAVGRVWTFNDISERERLLRRTLFLADASRLLASLDVERGLEAVARLVVPILGDGCAIDLAMEGGPRRLLSIQRDPSRPFFTEPSPGLWARQPTIDTTGPGSTMVVPLEGHDGRIGAITFTAAPGRRYGEDDLKLAEELARRCSAALENAELYRRTKDALQVRDEFISIAAHEIRGPVTSIHLAAQMLNMPNSGTPQRARATSVILREDRRLAQFVDELLDVARIRGGRFHFAFEEMDLAQICREAVTRLGPELAASGSSLSLNAPAEARGTWDRLRLEQLVANLLANAIKFGGGKPIEIGLALIADGVELKVIDHGMGIPAEMQEKIFKPFERAVSSRHYGGLGLGLYIVRLIAEGHGGDVRVQSKPGEGSTFIVHLPRSRA